MLLIPKKSTETSTSNHSSQKILTPKDIFFNPKIITIHKNTNADEPYVQDQHPKGVKSKYT